MTSRRYGDSSASSLDLMLAHSAVLRTGTVESEQVLNNKRLYSVSYPNAAESSPYCEACNVSEADKIKLVGQRVLVAQLGDGRAVIIGALGAADPNLQRTRENESDPNQPRTKKIGVDDRVFEWAGSQIVFTSEGDIVLLPKRAVRVETNLFRIQVDGDATDAPVAAKPFTDWARKVDAMLERHEAWIIANTLTGDPHAHTPPTIPATQPDIDSVDVYPEGVKMPSGGS